ncbi:hypothetical protein HY968_03895 [Candidatus Kaiserbacteria bacterium]|nr:hypothetical protein [Candidatus Kaiserbacteria bacterium]
MPWIQSHPYLATLAGAGFLLTIGAFTVTARLSAPPVENSITAWNGGQGITQTSAPAQYAPPAQNPGVSPGYGAATYKYVSPFATSVPPSAANDDVASFNSFLAQLSYSTVANDSRPTPDTSLEGAYAFIPSGFFSTGQVSVSRTKDQRLLYDFGNDVGNIIQGFEFSHGNQVAILKNFAEDGNDTGKQAAMRQLGADLADVGAQLDGLDSAPAYAASALYALAASYRDIGNKLASIPDGHGDAEIITRMETYDAAADKFVSNYVALALIFPAYGVSFQQDDPGSIFMLQQGGTSF